MRCFRPARGESVELGLAVALRESPLRVEPAFVFHPVQRRVERALFDLQLLARGLLDRAHDGEPVHRAPGEGLEDRAGRGCRERGRVPCPWRVESLRTLGIRFLGSDTWMRKMVGLTQDGWLDYGKGRSRTGTGTDGRARNDNDRSSRATARDLQFGSDPFSRKNRSGSHSWHPERFSFEDRTFAVPCPSVFDRAAP